MWNHLSDVKDDENATNENTIKKGFFYTLKKYKKIILILLPILIIYIFFIVHYEINERKVEKDIDCNILNDECKNYVYPKFDKNRLIIVDANLERNNFILRSNIPIFDGKFSEELLLKEIKKKIEDSNLVFYNNYSLYIISLLHLQPKEICVYASEKCYVKNAKIQHESICGSIEDDPSNLDEQVVDKKLRNLTWNTDDLLNKAKNLNHKFNTMKNTIFLIHCLRGKDRTGEYVGAYRMLIKKHSYPSIIKSNSEIGELKARFVRMTKWMCLYLVNVLKYPDLECYKDVKLI